jgi:hypothetical protein
VFDVYAILLPEIGQAVGRNRPLIDRWQARLGFDVRQQMEHLLGLRLGVLLDN